MRTNCPECGGAVQGMQEYDEAGGVAQYTWCDSTSCDWTLETRLPNKNRAAD